MNTIEIETPEYKAFRKRVLAITETRVPVLNALGQVTSYRRPKRHPLLPHPGTGPGAQRMVARDIQRGLWS